MENILFKEPWMDFLDNYYLNYNVIEYPKNIYFTANVLFEYLEKNSNLYQKYPYAEKFDISTLNTIDWKSAVITMDKHGKLIIAPEPLKQLVNLNKRLNYKKARKEIFGGFLIPFIQIKSFALIIFIMIIILFIKVCIYFDLFYRFQFL